jgi:hypothetical protein
MEQCCLGFVRALYVLLVVANKNAVKRSPAMKRSIRSAKAKRAGVLRGQSRFTAPLHSRSVHCDELNSQSSTQIFASTKKSKHIHYQISAAPMQPRLAPNIRNGVRFGRCDFRAALTRAPLRVVPRFQSFTQITHANRSDFNFFEFTNIVQRAKTKLI